MVSPTRPFKCPFMSVVKGGGKHRFPNLMRVSCWDRDRSWTKFVSWFVCLKNDIFVSEYLEDMYLGDDGVKELVIICDHIHFSSLPKGRGCGKTHVTLIQEMVLRRLAFYYTFQMSRDHFLGNASNGVNTQMESRMLISHYTSDRHVREPAQPHVS